MPHPSRQHLGERDEVEPADTKRNRKRLTSCADSRHDCRMRRLTAFASLSAAVILFASAADVHSQDTPPAPASTTLTFTVRGLRNNTGTVAGGVYIDPQRWPQPRGEAAVCRSPIRNNVSRCTIRVPAGGRYAFAFVHDEDGDGRIRQDFFGVPQEGYGFANDAHSGLSAPSFESAAVTVAMG